MHDKADEVSSRPVLFEPKSAYSLPFTLCPFERLHVRMWRENGHKKNGFKTLLFKKLYKKKLVLISSLKKYFNYYYN